MYSYSTHTYRRRPQDVHRCEVLAGLSLALLLAGCEKVPTFDELTGKVEKPIQSQPATPVQPPVVDQQPAPTPPPVTPAVPPKPDPATVIAQFRQLRPGQITDGHLVELAALGPEHLQEFDVLDFARGGVTDGGLAELTKFPNLRSVNATGTPITPEGVAALRHIPTLQELALADLPHPAVQDRAPNFNNVVPVLGSMPQLRSLDLTNSRIDKGMLSQIGQLGQLERLILNGMPLGDDGVGFVSQLVNLRELGLDTTGITDNAFVHFEGLSRLEVINVRMNNINGLGFQVLRNKPLRWINASNTSFAANGFRFIGGSKTLEWLGLHQAGVSDLGCKLISGMKNLREVNVSNNPAITDQGIALFASLPELERLNISELKNVTDNGVRRLVNCKKLQWLHIGNTSCTPQVVAFLKQPAPRGLPDLQVLGP